jgi:hypothetical protein
MKCLDANQQSLENVLVCSQMHPSDSTRVVEARKSPRDQLTSLPKQLLAINSVRPPPVRIDRLLLLVFALSMSLARLLLLRNVRSYFRAKLLHQCRAATLAGRSDGVAPSPAHCGSDPQPLLPVSVPSCPHHRRCFTRLRWHSTQTSDFRNLHQATYK